MEQTIQMYLAFTIMLKHVMIIVEQMEDLVVLHAITSMDVDGVL